MPVKREQIERLKKERGENPVGLKIEHQQTPEQQEQADRREEERASGDEWDRPPGFKNEDDTVITYEEVMERARQRVSAQLVGFDPLIIVAVIAAVIQLLGLKKSNERTAQAVQDACNRRPFGCLVRLHLALSRQGVPAKDRAKAAAALLDVGKAATFNEVVAFCDCCNVLDPEG
jgi:hypothetical protein